MTHFTAEPDHITQIRRQLQRYVTQHAPRDKTAGAAMPTSSSAAGSIRSVKPPRLKLT